MDTIDEDTASLLRKRVYDMTGTVKDIKVFLNGERLKVKNFKQYVKMYVSSAQAAAAENSGSCSGQTDGHPRTNQPSLGGRIYGFGWPQMAKGLITAIQKKNKAATVKPIQIKNDMWIFVNALIENPTFDSETKETLTLPSSKFGSRPSLS
jgi:DNA topoisomerase-2